MTPRLKFIYQLRNRYLFGVDLVLMGLSPILALLLRTESIDSFGTYANPLAVYLLVSTACKALVFVRTGLYSEYWAYASVQELSTLIRSTLLSMAAVLVLFFALLMPTGLLEPGFPRSIPFLDGLLTLVFIGGVRLSIRMIFAMSSTRHGDKELKPALIAGAGAAGTMVVKELQTNPQLGYRAVGYLDDDPRKNGSRIHGTPVLGALKDLPKVCTDHKIARVIIAMPTAPGKVVRQVLQLCRVSDVESRTIPGLFEILQGIARVDQFRKLQLEDLLRRGPVQTNTTQVEDMITGARVMVSGAGGSIGSELCRQIMTFGPAEMVLLGHGENSVFSIARELEERRRPGLSIQSVVADIRDRERMNQVFSHYLPQLVFHAAAHKHVGLMESNYSDAVTNNVLGTMVLIDMAERHGADRFVLVSTDKAVNPTSIMGVTKRVAELLVQEAASRTNRAFVTVRFGNVLGSRGSVVPLFKRQIELGGPVTVTHPEVLRFFMTIPEAVQLVLQAGTMGSGGEVFVLDMGEQIRVVDLAKDLIRLSGLEEGRDIEIVFTGLRPGEKMTEELFHATDKIEKTEHEKILVSRKDDGASHVGEVAETGNALLADVETLIEAAQRGREEDVRNLLKKLVPQYMPPSGPAIDITPQAPAPQAEAFAEQVKK